MDMCPTGFGYWKFTAAGTMISRLALSGYTHRAYLVLVLASLVLLSWGGLHHYSPKLITSATSATGGRFSGDDRNHNETEAIYRKSHGAAMQHLMEYPEDWGTSNVWFLVAPFHTCPLQERMGRATDGGKWVCTSALSQSASQQRQAGISPRCHVFSLGSNGEVSFEREFHGRFSHCAIHTFDHTLNAFTAWRVGAMPGVIFHPQGIATNAQLAKGDSQFTSINASMAQLGVEWLDILKIDIEGAEWEVFLEMLENGMPMPFTQVLMEIHAFNVPEGTEKAMILRRFFTGMHSAGFRVFAVEPNHNPSAPARCCFEYAFIKVDAEGHTIRPLHPATSHDR